MLHSIDDTENSAKDPVEAHAYLKDFSIIHRLGILYHMHHLKPYNLSGHQMGYIAYLSQHPGISQEQLSQFFHLNKATIAKGIRGLTEDGFILRQPSQKDKRAYELYLTEKAQNAIRQLEETTRSFVKILLEGMSDEEKETFEQLLSRAAKNVINTVPDRHCCCSGSQCGEETEHP